MKFGVVVFPGSNCDRDMIHVLEEALHEEVHVIWHKENALPGFDQSDCIILPGGFSYGDYLRSGAIARFSPVMKSVVEFANGGGYLMGICNGFQILCEAGLLPGALLHNQSRQFQCEQVYIRPAHTHSALTGRLDTGKAYKIPIAHGEGNYYTDPATLRQLIDNEQVLFQYCDAGGQVTPEANPNGSLYNIAGICNVERNVFGMMPHPERAAEDALGNTDGLAILASLQYAMKHREVDVMDDLLK